MNAALQRDARELGEYRLLTKLASGGMATVFVGAKRGAKGFERQVAIKVCHPHLVENPDFVSLFFDEARLAASIRHPNVVGTYDVGRGDVLYLVMEYIEGATLGNLLHRVSRGSGRLPLPITLRIMREVLAGLHAAHELVGPDGRHLGVVHRDISPHNVLVGLDGIARITDFGIAFAEARSVLTREGQVKGKFSYLAPESICGASANRRMDIFSAGVVLWETLTGRALFRRGSDGETMRAIIDDDPPPPSSLNPDVPPELDRVVLRALSKDPGDRFATAAEFEAALAELELDDAEGREVGSIVEKHFGGELAERRDKIRSEPGTPIDFTPPFIRVPASTKTTKPPESLMPPEPGHRFARGLIVAVMLILVGGALGQLLWSQSPKAVPVHTGSPR